MKRIDGPFGPANYVDSMAASHVAGMYREKCGYDPDFSFLPDGSLHRYECAATGYRFWRPAELAGDEQFYRDISAIWPGYYQEWRWEYRPALAAIKGAGKLVEIGCGRGYFLRAAERAVDSVSGLEFNEEAIANKVTRADVEAAMIEDYAARHPETCDAVVSFQVLEHVVDPASFLKAACALLRPGGRLVVSTPDADCMVHILKQDAFDMPPHHIGQFNAECYRRIAPQIGMELIDIVHQPRVVRSEPVYPGTRDSFSYKFARAVGYLPMRLAYALNKEPGQTLMAVYRKPGG